MNAPDLPDETLFENALKCRTPAERVAYLDQACAGPSEFRRRVDALIEAHERSGAFLEAPVAERPTFVLELSPKESPGTMVGRYKLLQRIGEGGMGDVYMAEQIEPVTRKVALKIIKLGMDTRQVIGRFEAERQALALMDHPNIARVLDGGATETGRPYFVMELVHGVPITEYCDKNRLSAQARLKLFLPVCQAIQHAHHKGIIHRDIKPSNVMVTLHDGQPVPRVIDFGIAKATNQRLTEKTVFTHYAQMIGTPAYMSPEQAEVSGLDIDTRTDVYSLGVLLYELLTGTTPFERKELLSKGYAEMQKMIAQQEPPRPSTRMSTMRNEARTVIASNRSMDESALRRLMQGDLDWIVMKCLEKDRTRRYETANGLAADIQRHLKSEPVVARPPSAAYRFRKAIRRNKVAFAGGAAVAASLVLGLGISVWQAVRARDAAREQTRLRLQAESSEHAARTEVAKSEQVARFLTDVLQGVGPSVAVGRDTTLIREILDKTVDRIGNDLGEQPEVAVQLMVTIGNVYWELGDSRQAERMADAALSRRHLLEASDQVQVSRALTLKGNILYGRGAYSEAETVYREALAIERQHRNAPHPRLAVSLNNLANARGALGDGTGAEALYRGVVEMARKLDDHTPLLLGLRNLAMSRGNQGDYVEAEALILELLEVLRRNVGYEHPDVADAIWLLAELRSSQGQIDDAEELGHEAFVLYRKLMGENHPGQIKAIRTMGDSRLRRGDLAGAESSYREALALQLKSPDSSHDQFASVLFRLSGVLVAQGRLSEAEASMSELLKVATNSITRAALLGGRGGLRARTCRWPEAAEDVTRAIEISPDNHLLYHDLAPLLVRTGDVTDYQKLCRTEVELFRETQDPNIAERMAKDCLILPNSGVDLKVVAAWADLAVTAGKDSNHLPWFQSTKALTEYRQGRFAEAREWAQKALKHSPQVHRDLQATAVLAMSEYRLGKTNAASTTLARAHELETTLPRPESGDIGDGWLDWIIAHSLLSEVKGLIEVGRVLTRPDGESHIHHPGGAVVKR